MVMQRIQKYWKETSKHLGNFENELKPEIFLLVMITESINEKYHNLLGYILMVTRINLSNYQFIKLIYSEEEAYAF